MDIVKEIIRRHSFLNVRKQFRISFYIAYVRVLLKKKRKNKKINRTTTMLRSIRKEFCIKLFNKSFFLRFNELFKKKEAFYYRARLVCNKCDFNCLTDITLIEHN